MATGTLYLSEALAWLSKIWASLSKEKDPPAFSTAVTPASSFSINSSLVVNTS